MPQLDSDDNLHYYITNYLIEEMFSFIMSSHNYIVIIILLYD